MNLKRGFTLVELLIVIAIIGILATGLFVALDPVDQIRRGQDTTLRQTAIEIRRAIDRYYASQQQMPWCQGGTNGATCASPEPAGTLYSTMNANTNAGFFNLKGQLEGSELKTITNPTEFYISGNNLAGTATVCFQPDSKAFKADKNDIYTSAGVLVSGTTLATQCVAQGGSLKTCYYCIN